MVRHTTRSMQYTLAQLDAELDRFHADLEAKLAANPNAADLAGDINLMVRAMQAVAGPYRAHVQERISCMLDSLA